MYENDNGMPDETKPAHGRYGMPAGMWGAGICYLVAIVAVLPILVGSNDSVRAMSDGDVMPMAIVSLAFAIIGSLMSIKAYVSGNSESTGDKEGGTADSAVDASTSKAKATVWIVVAIVCAAMEFWMSLLAPASTDAGDITLALGVKAMASSIFGLSFAIIGLFATLWAMSAFAASLVSAVPSE